MQYVVTAIKSVIPAGMTIELNERQAAARKKLLEPSNKKGLYRVVDQVEFKHGEIIGFPGDIRDKVLMPTLVPVEDPDKKQPEKKGAANAGAGNPLSASSLPA